MKPEFLFLDGRMVKTEAELVDSLAPGVVQGRGVFETMRVYDGTIFTLEDHLARLARGLKALKIRSPFSKVQLRKYLDRVIRVNHLTQAKLRLSVWKEQQRLRMAIVGQEFKGYPASRHRKGFKAAISDVRRAKTCVSHIKSLDYGCFREAFAQAKRQRYDEAILLNNRNELVEGSRTNIFFIRKGVLYTPATRCGCLNGITRQIVIRSARRLSIPCRVVAAGVHRLLQADEAFVTNSLLGIMPLRAVEGKRIGSGGAGPITQKLQSAYRTIVHSSCPAQSESV